MSGATPTYLAFDYGERRIGVAVGQRLTATATPLRVIAASDGTPHWEDVSALIEEWKPQAVVVGLPLNMDGTEQPITGRARRFGHRLAGRYGLQVHFADERLSTREAWNQPSAGRRRKDSRQDAVAAKLILESWMRQVQD